jgi:hypothetical protein
MLAVVGRLPPEPGLGEPVPPAGQGLVEIEQAEADREHRIARRSPRSTNAEATVPALRWKTLYAGAVLVAPCPGDTKPRTPTTTSNSAKTQGPTGVSPTTD